MQSGPRYGRSRGLRCGQDVGGGLPVVGYDVVVVGSGFGGSVAALRLTEKGYRVGVLEAGRRFADDELATTSWQLRKFLWAPALGCYGIQRIHLLRELVVLAGAGVGGGSLNYANTLYRPPDAFFDDPQWAHLADWRAELNTHYDEAERMLGVTTYAGHTAADEVIQRVARDMGVAKSYHPTPVGVFFGPPGEEVDDPYFGGAGPRRTGCTECGSCMTGCRVGAKNTLVKNYLYLAERAGATVHPLTTVTAVRPQADGTWLVDAVRTGKLHIGPVGRKTIRANQVVIAAGTWGTQQLLHRMRDEGVLPRLSPRLGELTRSNSEAIVGASRATVDPARDFSHGVAITSSFHPDEHTHIEPVRYGRGSNAMALLQTAATDGASDTPRWKQLLRFTAQHPVTMVRLLKVRRWSERTVILLVMQTLDNSLTTYRRRGRLTSRPGHGEPNPTFIPAGLQASKLTAQYIGGTAGGTWGELFGLPLTAHFLGGCPMGATAADGVIDAQHRVHGYPGLSVVDGSAISANLGVNPALTITALAERAISLWPKVRECH
ncbi:MAG: cholesterol oxidase [Pseudonocardiales bacterium]|nr:GMC family oxidoreductase [Pseudonocardiales bacterium]PZS27602.1 MAG: cholesterol oxidase [Pseudonocardiales bacterium]